VKVDSGTLLVGSTAEIQSLQVAQNATFGGPGIITLSGGQAVFSPGSTYAVTLAGTSTTGHTRFHNDDEDPSGDGTGVVVTGSILSVTLAPGYIPNPGNKFTIIDASNGSTANTVNPDIEGQFVNAPDGSTRTFGGVPFYVTYQPDPNHQGKVNAVILRAESLTVAVDANSKNPSSYGQPVQFDATVTVPGNSSAVPTGTVQFYDGTPGAGGTPIGQPVPLNANAVAISPPIATLAALGSPHKIYAVYTATGDSASSTTQAPYQETVNPATLTITAQPNTKTYDGKTAAAARPTFQVAGLPANTLFNGDTLTGLAEAYDTKNAGTGKTLAVSPGCTLTDNNGGHDYTVTLVASTVGEIDTRALTITARPVTKTYDGTTPAPAVPIYSGLQPGDTLTGLAETYDTPDVGTGKTLTVSTGYTLADGNGGHNYTVKLIPNTDGVIDPKPVTVRSVTILKESIRRRPERAIVLQFSGALNMADAQGLAPYTMITIPSSKKKRGRPVRLEQASYDPTTFTVMLFPLKPLALNSPVQLTINAALLPDATGQPLDGNDSGHPGTNFVARLNKGGVSITAIRPGPAVRPAAHAWSLAGPRRTP
jgi:hypothetical protein